MIHRCIKKDCISYNKKALNGCGLCDPRHAMFCLKADCEKYYIPTERNENE
jgi:hypothetical protein